MKLNRSTVVGAGVGLALGMPLFEVFLLTILAIDGELFDASLTIRYFSQSANVIILLIVLHIITAAIGALIGSMVGKQRGRHLQVLPGQAARGRS